MSATFCPARGHSTKFRTASPYRVLHKCSRFPIKQPANGLCRCHLISSFVQDLFRFSSSQICFIYEFSNSSQVNESSDPARLRVCDLAVPKYMDVQGGGSYTRLITDDFQDLLYYTAESAQAFRVPDPRRKSSRTEQASSC